MHTDIYQTIGPDSPLGDREGADEDWTPQRVEEISKEEVKNPHDEPGRKPKPTHQPERDVEESERQETA